MNRKRRLGTQQQRKTVSPEKNALYIRKLSAFTGFFAFAPASGHCGCSRNPAHRYSRVLRTAA